MLDAEYEIRCGADTFVGGAGSFVFVPDEAGIAAHYGQEFLDRLRHWGQ